MSTQSWTTRVRHDSDATYQEWRDELITKLNLMSELTADETTVVAASGSRPSTNTEESYAVYHLNDSLHGTAPVYLRFGFGTGSAATTPRIQATVGTSTNGSGVLGGTALSIIRICNSQAAATGDTGYQSFMSANSGFFGLYWKHGSNNRGGLIFCRTCDNTGAITATGGIMIWSAGFTSSFTATQAFRYAATAAAYTAQTVTANTMLGFAPQTPTSSQVSGDIQVYIGWTISPAVTPLFGVGGVYDAEVSLGTTFSIALVGSTSRTYIALADTFGPFAASSVGAGFPKFAMLWE